MCGIVGYVGHKEPVPFLIGGVEKLEYRGYDSAGVATIDSGEFAINRSEGNLAALKKFSVIYRLAGSLLIQELALGILVGQLTEGHQTLTPTLMWQVAFV